jgi:two-component system, OmpR family, flagellar system response regulator FtcR
MIVVVHHSIDVAEIFGRGFTREGFATSVFATDDFDGWIGTAAAVELSAVEAYFVGCYQDHEKIVSRVRKHSQAPVVILADNINLELVLSLFQLGVDDIVSHKTQVRVLIAKLGAITRRLHRVGKAIEIDGLKVYYDGRDPEYAGAVIDMPRRERRILEYLVMNQQRRVTRSQIFSAVYGLFNEEFDENVIESHISRLRKRLKHILGHDPIDSKRYLGYQFLPAPPTPARIAA